MLTLTGKIANVFKTDQRTDKKTGEVYAAGEKVQLQVDREFENGSRRLELITLAYPGALLMADRVGSDLSVPVGVFASGGQLQFYALKTISK